MNEIDEEKPWFRQFWPWFLIAIPLTGVVVGLTTLYVANQQMDEVIAQPHPALTRTSFGNEVDDD